MNDEVHQTASPRPYPVEWEADVVLRDGTTAHVRPIRPDDADDLQRFHMGQSERSRYLRFFAPLERLSDADLFKFTHVDHDTRVALIAVRDTEQDAEGGTVEGVGGQDIIGVGRYDLVEPGEAEVAFNIADSAQGKGLGSVLLEHLADAARERGFRRFTADVLPQNGKMLAVFREAGYDLKQSMEDGVVTVTFDIDPTQRSREVTIDREHRAEARSMQGLLGARSLVLVARWDGPDEIVAERALAAMVAGSANAQLHVVGLPSSHPVPEQVSTWQTVTDLPEGIELAVLAVPSSEAILAIRHLARVGVRGIVVVGGGYAEGGLAGRRDQRTLLRAAHANGMRVVGPASFGLFTTAENRVSAGLNTDMPERGTIGLFCQSAPMAVTLLSAVRRRRAGLSSFLSSGNRTDVSGNDLMQYWQEDPATSVVCLSLESIGNPRKFSRIARRLAMVKPVVVVTAGRSGQVVPPGHAVRSTKTPRRTLEEMMRQSGVIRAANSHELLDIAQLLAYQPHPAGRRVGILTSSPSLSALVAEAVLSCDLEVASTAFVPEDAPAEDVVQAMEALYAPGSCDVVVVVHIPVAHPRESIWCSTLARLAAHTRRPTLASILGLNGMTDELSCPDPEDPSAIRRIPAYATPEDAVSALDAVFRYWSWRAAEHGHWLAPDRIDRKAARQLVEERVGAGPVQLADADVTKLLSCYGIDLLSYRTAHTMEETVEAAEELGYPVAVKSSSRALRHRQDLGAVRLDLETADAVRAAYAQVTSVGEAVEGDHPETVEVQTMAPAGVACVIRASEDKLFGPVVSFGLAGDATDLLDDVSYGIPPLTDADVTSMVNSVKASARLTGYDGGPAVDVASVEDLLSRIAVMADDLPELQSMVLHPVVVAESGSTVLHARIVLAPARRPDGLRRALPA